ncbi:hypothetical protein D3C75_592930 [compost metagenome]
MHKQNGATTFKWGEAIEALKEGKRVTNISWNGKGMFLFLFSRSDFLMNDEDEGIEDHLMDEEVETIDHIGFEFDGVFYPIADFILLKTANGLCVPWNASQTDTLSEGWQIVD